MNKVPELPLEKILGYLSLEERIKAMVVSRKWRKMIGSFRPTSLFFSDRPSDFIYGKSRLIDGAFVRNCISSPRFEAFFNAFSQSILSNLKHLRLCDLDLNAQMRRVLMRTINSFGQLEVLDLFRLKLQGDSKTKITFKLNLPMLNSIHLEDLTAINRLTLDAPQLREVKILDFSGLKLDIHGKAVEKLVVDGNAHVEVKKMKNLKYLYTDSNSVIDSTFLPDLEQLEEIHLESYTYVRRLFEQKQRHGRAELKIFLCGLLLNGPDDPAIESLSRFFNAGTIRCLATNASRLADEIPFCRQVDYSPIESFPPGLEVDLLNRFSSLKCINLQEQVQDIERFLNLLKNYDSIARLNFGRSGQQFQPQTLFDRLPDHCAVQWLRIGYPPDNLQFLFRLQNLIYLDLAWQIDTQTIRQVLESLPFLCRFEFRYKFFYYWVTVNIDHHPRRRFHISFLGKSTTAFDVDEAIEFIVNPTQAKKRKAKATNLPAKSRKSSN